MSTRQTEGLGVRGSGLGPPPPSPEARGPSPTVVIGLGNPLMGDDGLGLAALARLRDEWDLPPEVELVDGGTWGITLLPVIEDAGRLLLLDALDTGAEPGTCAVIERSRIPKYLTTKVSPHQVDLRDVLALAELRGTLPDQTVAMGLQPARVELTTGLSDVVRSGVDGLVGSVVRLLESWGHRCTARDSELPEPLAPSPEPLNLHA